MSHKYKDYIENKKQILRGSGFEPYPISEKLYPFQKAITKWAIKNGRTALFEDCGLGKTIQSLEWGSQVIRYTGGNILILAPLAVSKQTKREGEKFDYNVNICQSQADVIAGINITNYEKLHKFDLSLFAGIVADESGILKNHAGKIRNQIIENSRDVPYKLACTATPAPNDYMELGNHAEFLGIMTRTEMLSTFFIHDSGETSKWRLKGHVTSEFWKWMSTWSVMIRSPKDIGFDSNGFNLPQLNHYPIVVEGSGYKKLGYFIPIPAQTLNERRNARRESIEDRVRIAAELVNKSDDFWVVWCDLNKESELLTRAIPGAVEVKGADSDEHKESAMIDFSEGKIRVIVSKPKIAGHGMNWQHCCNMIFVGLSDSWEAYYQAVRRCWRYGQKRETSAYIITSDDEGAVVQNIKDKEERSIEMHKAMVSQMKDFTQKTLNEQEDLKGTYKEKIIYGNNWIFYNGDAVEITGKMKADSIDYSIFSPPFVSLYTYSDSDRDLGNSKTHQDFFEHFKFLITELFRVIKPGRLVSIHCMNLPAMKERDGYIGMKDFRGDIIRAFEDKNFIFHSEVCIWKDPLIEVTRTKALGLQHKQLIKDSAMCRQGLPDYIVTMRKPGENKEMIKHPHGMTEFIGENEPKDGVFSHQVWRRYASPVWMDIRQTRTLNYKMAREKNDERHICPLQLDVIERCIDLWTNPGDIVLSPFAGVGSEIYIAVEKGRSGIAIELKETYFKQGLKNLENLKIMNRQQEIF